jgi:hypothetical protein
MCEAQVDADCTDYKSIRSYVLDMLTSIVPAQCQAGGGGGGARDVIRTPQFTSFKAQSHSTHPLKATCRFGVPIA